MAGAAKSFGWSYWILFLLVLPFFAMSGCSPWTVVPIKRAGDGQVSSQNTDPAAYVDSIWDSKLVPAILKDAVDARTLLSAMSSSMEEAERKYGRKSDGSAWYFNVKGEGRVSAADTSSSVGLLEIRVLPRSRNAEVSIQIGPVFRGSALRDSTGLISFSNFVNQLQFAEVANDLNNKAGQTVLASLDAKSLVGKTVRFAGSFEADTNTRPVIRNVVPVELEVEKPE